MAPRVRPVLERFWSKVEKTDTCWLWVGNIQASGYGQFWLKEGPSYAHRFAYELLVGPIPEDKQLDHLCHTNSDCRGGTSCLHRRCVNPDHLEAVTAKTNVLRGRSFAARFSVATHCVNGHLYNEANTYYYRDGRGRMCRECGRIRDRTRYYRLKGKPVPEVSSGSSNF